MFLFSSKGFPPERARISIKSHLPLPLLPHRHPNQPLKLSCFSPLSIVPHTLRPTSITTAIARDRAILTLMALPSTAARIAKDDIPHRRRGRVRRPGQVPARGPRGAGVGAGDEGDAVAVGAGAAAESVVFVADGHFDGLGRGLPGVEGSGVEVVGEDVGKGGAERGRGEEGEDCG